MSRKGNCWETRW